jgi:hypothetical protein
LQDYGHVPYLHDFVKDVMDVDHTRRTGLDNRFRPGELGRHVLHILALHIVSLSNGCRLTRTAPRETLGSGLPDRTMVTLWCRFSLGSIVCGAAAVDRG